MVQFRLLLKPSAEVLKSPLSHTISSPLILTLNWSAKPCCSQRAALSQRSFALFKGWLWSRIQILTHIYIIWGRKKKKTQCICDGVATGRFSNHSSPHTHTHTHTHTNTHTPREGIVSLELLISPEHLWIQDCNRGVNIVGDKKESIRGPERKKKKKKKI